MPAEFAPQNPTSNTTVKVSVIDGLIDVTSDEQESTGPTYSADDVNVDDYFDAGVGLYRVEVTNSGVGWHCDVQRVHPTRRRHAVGPRRLDRTRRDRHRRDRRAPHEGSQAEGAGLDRRGARHQADQIAREEAWQAAGRDHPDAVAFEERAAHSWAPPRSLKPNERVMWSGKVRRHGRWVAGFFWGLLLGFGIGLLGWQDARWTVNLGSIILLPLAVAVAGRADHLVRAGAIASATWSCSPRRWQPPPPEPSDRAAAPSGADVDPVADDTVHESARRQRRAEGARRVWTPSGRPRAS